MNSKINLVDIAGLDTISFWPFSKAVWALLGVAFLGLVFVLVLSTYLKRKRRSWQYQVLIELKAMEKSLSAENSRLAATQLSALMRRLAVQHFPRVECAGLQGEAWINFLKSNDRKKFDWSKLSKPLLVAPFSEAGSSFDVHAFQEAIHAAKGWVH